MQGNQYIAQDKRDCHMAKCQWRNVNAAEKFTKFSLTMPSLAAKKAKMWDIKCFSSGFSLSQWARSFDKSTYKNIQKLWIFLIRSTTYIPLYLGQINSVLSTLLHKHTKTTHYWTTCGVKWVHTYCITPPCSWLFSNDSTSPNVLCLTQCSVALHHSQTCYYCVIEQW